MSAAEKMVPDYDNWASSINLYVPDAQFASEVGVNGVFRAEFGALVAADTDGVLVDQSMEAAGNTSTMAATYARSKMGPWGRNLTMVAPASSTNTVTVTGRDYLGQPMKEAFTLNGTTPVAGKKAFAEVTNIAWTTDAEATAVDVGWGDVFGLPYRTEALLASIENDATATAATLVAGASSTTAQTATSADPRGTVDFNGTPDASRTFAVVAIADKTQLFGIAQYYA